MKDIKPGKSTVEALLASENRYRLCLENIDVGVTLIGTDYRIRWVNPTVARWFAKDADEFVGKYCYKEFEQRDRVCDYCPAVKAIATGRPNEAETQGIKPDGTTFTVRERVFPIIRDGKVIAFSEIVEDITEHKRTEVALKASRDQLAAIVDRSPIPTAVGGSEGLIISFNQALEKLIGYKSDEIKDVTDWASKLYPDSEYRNFVMGNIQQALRGEEQECTEFTVSCKDGSKRILDFHTSFFKDGLIVQMVDITERKRDEDEIRWHSRLSDTMIRMQTHFIHDMDASVLFDRMLGDILDITESEYGFIGAVHHTADGAPYLKTWAITNIAWNDETRKFYEENATKGLEFFNLKTLFGKCLTSEQPVIANEPATDPRRGGIPKDHPTLNAFLCLPLHAGPRFIGMVGVANRPGGYAVDIARKLKPLLGSCANIIEAYQSEGKRKLAEKALIESQRLGAIGEMASAVAHDFNNSLQAIFGNLELTLLEPGLPETAQGYLKTLKTAVVDAATRVQMLQRFGGKKRTKSEYNCIDLNTVVSDVIAQSRPLWKDQVEKNGRVISMEPGYGEIPKIAGNDGELRAVVYNIVRNSIEAMPEGGKITFKTGKTEKGVHLTISDTGTGMDEETVARVFQPFYSTMGFEVGRGLGLSGAYSIIKEHDGEIFIKKSIPGKGTSIEIILPCLIEKEKEEKMKAIIDCEGCARVLWVDDEEKIRISVELLIMKLGHKIDVAASGEEALEYLDKNECDLVITDIGMPGMSGWELADKIKEKFQGKMKVAVVTGWGPQVSEAEKNLHGVGYVLGKPVSQEQIKSLIDEAIQVGN
ncbi:PAS domain S-box protein [Candidatus Riflebacteria bacterium]